MNLKRGREGERERGKEGKKEIEGEGRERERKGKTWKTQEDHWCLKKIKFNESLGIKYEKRGICFEQKL